MIKKCIACGVEFNDADLKASEIKKEFHIDLDICGTCWKDLEFVVEDAVENWIKTLPNQLMIVTQNAVLDWVKNLFRPEEAKN